MNRTVWVRHKFRLGKPGDGGDWSEDGAVGHGVEDGRTLCGIGIPFSPDGRWMHETWAHGCDIAFVTCVRCRRALEREGG